MHSDLGHADGAAVRGHDQQQPGIDGVTAQYLAALRQFKGGKPGTQKGLVHFSRAPAS
jgi:hypothetical protein